MRLVSQVTGSIPRLAWVASLRRGRPELHVLRGMDCEFVDGQMVCEGSWSGGPEDGWPFERAFNCSTGVGCRAGRVYIWTPSHPYDKVFVLRTDEVLLASNSLVAILSAMDDAPDPNCIDYHDILTAYIHGLDQPLPNVPTRSGRELLQLVAGVRFVDSDLMMQVVPRAPIAEARDFRSHVAFLTQSCRELIGNARAAGRQSVLRPVTTLSRGFDSPAVSVLARDAGCTTALTLVDARDAFGGGDDDGTPIGAALGLSVQAAARTDYLQRQDLVESSFLASGVGGEDVVMAVFEESLRRAMLFTGIGGDVVWNAEAKSPERSVEFVSKSFGGASLQEYRLAVGFCHVPLPSMLCPIHPSLHRLSSSDEMDPWRDGRAGYVRPIPTRIAVEAGVARALFGQTKQAVTQPFYHNYDLAGLMSARSYDDFQTYLADCGVSSGGNGPGPSLAKAAVRLFRTQPVAGVEKILRQVTGRAVELRSVLPVRRVATETGYAYAMHWAHARLSSRLAATDRAFLEASA